MISFWTILFTMATIATIGVDRTMAAESSMNMTVYKTLIEPESCKSELKAENLSSIYVWDNSLQILYTDTVVYKQINWNPKSHPENDPIIHLKFKDKKDKIVFSKDYNQKVYDEFMKKFKTLYYYPVDFTTAVFIFAENEKQHLLVVYVFKEENDAKIGIVGKVSVPSGTIPLFLVKKNDAPDKNQRTKFETILINNKDYSYQMAKLNYKSDVKLVMQGTKYYYGFNTNVSTIYFASQISHLERYVDNYLPASAVVGNGWHPFQCYDYIYIVVTEWVLIFPKLDLVTKLLQAKPDTFPVYSAAVTVFHRNSLFRCFDNESSLTPPNYPKKDIKVFVESPSNITPFVVFLVTMIILSSIAAAGVAAIYFVKRRQGIQQSKLTPGRKSGGKSGLKSRSKINTTTLTTTTSSITTTPTAVKATVLGMSSRGGKSSINAKSKVGGGKSSVK